MGRYVLTVPAKQDLKEINRYIALFNPEAAKTQDSDSAAV